MQQLSDNIKPFVISHRQHQLEDTKRLKSSPDPDIDSQQSTITSYQSIGDETPVGDSYLKTGLQIFPSISGSTSHDDHSHGVAESESYSPDKSLVRQNLIFCFL